MGRGRHLHADELVPARSTCRSWPTRASTSQPGRENLKTFSEARRTCSAASAARSPSRAARPPPTARCGRASCCRARATRPLFEIAAAAARGAAGRRAQRLRRLEPGRPGRHAHRDRAHRPRHERGAARLLALLGTASHAVRRAAVFPAGISYGRSSLDARRPRSTRRAADDDDRGAQHPARRGQRPSHDLQHAGAGRRPQRRRHASARSRCTAASRPSTAAATRASRSRGDVHRRRRRRSRRTDGVSWASAGFVVGQAAHASNGVVARARSRRSTATTLTLTGGTFGAAAYTDADRRRPRPEDGRDADRRRHDRHHRRRRARLAARRLRRHVAGRHSGTAATRASSRSATSARKPFPNEIGNGDAALHLPASPTRTASPATTSSTRTALFAGVAAGALPTVGFTAYGGAGDDTDHRQRTPATTSPAARATTRSAARGSDQIYGDNGVNVDVITRELTIPWVNASVDAEPRRPRAPATTCSTATRRQHGPSTRGEYDDVVFGDYGDVTQDISHATVVGPTTATSGRRRRRERIQTDGPHPRRRAPSASPTAASTRSTANGGDDFVFGGTHGDTIDGATARTSSSATTAAITGIESTSSTGRSRHRPRHARTTTTRSRR